MTARRTRPDPVELDLDPGDTGREVDDDVGAVTRFAAAVCFQLMHEEDGPDAFLMLRHPGGTAAVVTVVGAIAGRVVGTGFRAGEPVLAMGRRILVVTVAAPGIL
jgi:hypothetical protein